MLDLKNCKVRWDRERYIPRKVYGFEAEPAKGTPKNIAEAFLKENLKPLKISALPDDLKFEKTVQSLGAYAVLFQQHYKGVPIHGAWVAVHINKEKKVFMVKNDTVPAAQLEKKIARMKRQVLPVSTIKSLVRKKIKEYGILSSPVKKESMIYALKGTLRKVWKIKFGTRKPAASWILFIDSITGEIIEERNVLRRALGKGLVFIPNPVVALDRDDLFDEKDKDQDIFRDAYRTVALKDLTRGGCLKGRYVDTSITPKCATSGNLTFMFKRQDDTFEEVMAYYHIDSLQRYIQSLGFIHKKGILDHAIKVNAHGGYEDNSYYDPSPGKHTITFGDGGVDDAEDADVIIHEYGHALQDAIVPGFGQGNEARAMGEGFGDYLAGSFFYKFKNSSRRPKIGEWDAKGFAGGAQECLRRLDSSHHYPEDMEGEEHADGEIWSACLWKVRKLLGRKKSDTVILESTFYLNQYADFKDGAEAILMAEQNLYGGRKQKGLRRIFRERGIL